RRGGRGRHRRHDRGDEDGGCDHGAEGRHHRPDSSVRDRSGRRRRSADGGQLTRIIAGSAGGRRIAVPTKGTRPTSDRVREALFSALSARLDLVGMTVLDLYAGSGALGLEALSRGAAKVTFVEVNAKTAALIGRNADALG